MSLDRIKIKLKIGFIVDEDYISNNYNDLLAEINSDDTFLLHQFLFHKDTAILSNTNVSLF